MKPFRTRAIVPALLVVVLASCTKQPASRSAVPGGEEAPEPAAAPTYTAAQLPPMLIGRSDVRLSQYSFSQDGEVAVLPIEVAKAAGPAFLAGALSSHQGFRDPDLQQIDSEVWAFADEAFAGAAVEAALGAHKRRLEDIARADRTPYATQEVSVSLGDESYAQLEVPRRREVRLPNPGTGTVFTHTVPDRAWVVWRSGSLVLQLYVVAMPGKTRKVALQLAGDMDERSLSAEPEGAAVAVPEPTGTQAPAGAELAGYLLDRSELPLDHGSPSLEDHYAGPLADVPVGVAQAAGFGLVAGHQTSDWGNEVRGISHISQTAVAFTDPESAEAALGAYEQEWARFASSYEADAESRVTVDDLQVPPGDGGFGQFLDLADNVVDPDKGSLDPFVEIVTDEAYVAWRSGNLVFVMQAGLARGADPRTLSDLASEVAANVETL